MRHSARSGAPASQVFADVGGRYEIHEVLGRGGMACVYRATDRALSRQVALKQLVIQRGTPEHTTAAALFEREFHTLMQLRHPHVIEVHDYGLTTDANPFYTMELLDGGDLRDRTPLDWRQACRLAFDVCSALALLHSRRLLHRDVSPRNIRCTRTGEAKLIDFGALAPMSAGGSEVVGTPAFTAPETLQRLALDARTDLYSLGASLYYALTGRLPYAARSFSEVLAAWRVKPLPPSAVVRDIPPALDDLVLALLGIEPGLRPQSAFAVMQQLAACAGLRVEESEAVSRAYLSTPSLVGREGLLLRVRDALREATLTPSAGLLFEGPAGSGRSRLLDACALEAQTRGYTVLRASATGSGESFASARALSEHLLDVLPHCQASEELNDLLVDAPAADTEAAFPARRMFRNLAAAGIEPARVQSALRTLWTSVSITHPLLIAVDDVHKLDEPSAALLAEVIDKARRGGILIALTADSCDKTESAALTVLARRCNSLQVTALNLEHTRALLGSLFGDVANLDMLASEVDRVAHGNPRQCLELAQHMVDRGTIHYAAGHWTLPASLSVEDLPCSTTDALRARIERMSAHARFLAEAQSLAFYETFTGADYHALLHEASATDVELALSELLSMQALVRDADGYRLAHRIWSSALVSELGAEETKLRHRALAQLYAQAKSLAFIHHAFLCGMDAQALDALELRNEQHQSEADLLKLVDQNVGKLIWCYPHAIARAQALGRRPRAVHDLRRWQYLGSLLHRGVVDNESVQLWVAQLAHDTGLDLYRADTETHDPAQRVTRALQGAYERYMATPESERVYPLDLAIRRLAEYVVVSIAVSANTLDFELTRRLPGLIEPFVSLSPLLEAIWNNALACVQSHVQCNFELARDRWRETLIKLDALDGQQETFVDGMRNAIAFAIGLMEAQIGQATAADMADRMDTDPYQRISALDLRRIVRLEQGDADSADRLRRKADVLSLQLRMPPMFKLLLMVELVSYTRLGDLQSVGNVVEQLKRLAAQLPRWQASLLVAQASFQLVRGDHEAALALFEQGGALTAIDASGESPQLGTWLIARGGSTECLLALGRTEQAHALASAAVALCESKQVIAGAFDLVRNLALAEGKLGDARAPERLDGLIALQTKLGSTGLRLGLSYEARARVAIWSRDAAAFERFAELTAHAYRYGARTALAARYERLVNEASRCGMYTGAKLSDFAVLASDDTSAIASEALTPSVARGIASAPTPERRAQLALHMICAAHGSGLGHLYLLGPQGLELRASRGGAVPVAELTESATRYLAVEQQRSEALDDMLTGELSDDELQSDLIHVADVSYEFLPLLTIVDAVSTPVGVAVVAVHETRVRNQRQAQLLSTVAESLLKSGDCAAERAHGAK